MNELEIWESCRANFNKYTEEAFSFIPKIDKPNILDLGCGTGVPAILLAELTNGKITSIDTDQKSLTWFREKVEAAGYTDRINIIHDSILNVDLPKKHFDIILAEGVLHIIGFEKGLSYFTEYIKDNGYFMIHDEVREKKNIQQIFKRNGYQLLYSKTFDETVWWNEYCGCLEKKIMELEKEVKDENVINEMFKRERSEIEMYRSDPSKFRSMYNVLRKI